MVVPRAAADSPKPRVQSPTSKTAIGVALCLRLRALGFGPWTKKCLPSKSADWLTITATAAALDGVDFAVAAGTIFGLLGPNGGGKTTLFRILSTLLPIQTGSAEVLGFDLATEPNLIRRHIGVTFQSPSIDPKLTVAENLRHQGHLYGLSGRRSPIASTC